MSLSRNLALFSSFKLSFLRRSSIARVSRFPDGPIFRRGSVLSLLGVFTRATSIGARDDNDDPPRKFPRSGINDGEITRARVFPSVSLLLRGRSNVASAIGATLSTRYRILYRGDNSLGTGIELSARRALRSPKYLISLARRTRSPDRSAFDSAWAGCYHSDKRVDRVKLRLRRFAKRPARALFHRRNPHGYSRSATQEIRIHLESLPPPPPPALPGDRINVSVFPSWRVISDCRLP